MTGHLAIYAASFAVGAVCGAGYFALLWIAVRTLVEAGNQIGFAALALIRIGLVLCALATAFIFGMGAGEIIVAFAGFLSVRVIAARWIRMPEAVLPWK